MARNIYVMSDEKGARRRRTLRMAAFGFLGGVAAGAACLILPKLLAPAADQQIESPVMAMSSELLTASAAPVKRAAVPVMHSPVQIQRFDCRSVSVHDGDTFRCDGTKIRLVAGRGPIDAPEFLDSPRCEPGRDGWCDQAIAERARDRLATMLNNPTLQIDCGRYDRYDRALCRASVDGRDAGDTLVDEGLAKIEERWRH